MTGPPSDVLYTRSIWLVHFLFVLVVDDIAFSDFIKLAVVFHGFEMGQGFQDGNSSIPGFQFTQVNATQFGHPGYDIGYLVSGFGGRVQCPEDFGVSGLVVLKEFLDSGLEAGEGSAGSTGTMAACQRSTGP